MFCVCFNYFIVSGGDLQLPRANYHPHTLPKRPADIGLAGFGLGALHLDTIHPQPPKWPLPMAF